MPASPESLASGSSAAFLTQAMHAYGTLPKDARVASILRCEEAHGGNSGKKMLLDIVYENAPTHLPTQLFAKFSRDFDDAFRDRRRDELEGEIRLASLSRNPHFPVAVPQSIFADFERASGTGLLITERIAIGEGGIEPLHAKCMDHLLPDPLAHYRALITAQASLAAACHAGRLSPDLEALFPYDRASAEADLAISYDGPELANKVTAFCDFITRAPQLFPSALATPEWRTRFAAEAQAIYAKQWEIRAFLQSDPRFVALSHWNANVDNAWFWRDDAGALRCGLLDWGMVRPMNIATGLWGGFSAAATPFLAEELNDLLVHYVEELAAHGGPQISTAEIGVHFDMALAIAGLSLMMDLPALACARLPGIEHASGPLDPMIVNEKVVQGFLLVCTNFINLWNQRDFLSSLAQITPAKAAAF